MRNKDEAKQLKIKRACIELIYELGIEGISAGKLAKRSSVSASSIYVYYANMNEMFRVINEEITIDYFNNISKALDKAKSAEANFFALWEAAYQYCVSYPKEFIFTTRMEHSCSIDHKTAKDNQGHEKISRFIQTSVQDNKIKDMSVECFVCIAFMPFYGMLKSSIESGAKALDPKTQGLLRASAWQAIKI